MSIKVENNLKATDNKEIFDQRAHFIPCKIEENGPANVKQYFEPYVEETDRGELSATFRGRSLCGARCSLPAGYRAVLLTEAKRPLSEDAERRFQVASGFRAVLHWGWDKQASPNDSLAQCAHWTDVARAIHGDD